MHSVFLCQAQFSLRQGSPGQLSAVDGAETHPEVLGLWPPLSSTPSQSEADSGES